MRSRPLTAVALCALALLGGCSPDPPGPSAEDLKPAPVKTIDKQKAAVEHTLARYNLAVTSSLRPGRRTVPMSRIRAAVADPYATRLSRQLAHEQLLGLVMRGQDVYTTRRVGVSGDRARLVTCWDPSRARVVNTSVKSAEKVRPAPSTLTTFTLRHTSGGWRIVERIPGKRC